ncbi:putative FAD-linked oxidoreductase [Methanimicrococcus hongohii]|uniref:D-lactate dehydrogenase (cytochrome) n=1 Tax=Methanimicrococcus hongohii TaxID=3028295 RepID=A0AA96V9K5_9EURY|nr:FAD-linked oxidase C-terminal domain-containing protein [Methanimicrococcus sp. Hf6]WNY23971.1 putative FAD-linked oxidoreductase [Methanimicrococcus sp. Hf6]
MDHFEELKKICVGRTTNAPAELCCYAADGSQIKGKPDYVLFPHTTEEVSQILAYANIHLIPVTARGAGTGMAGGAVPVQGGILLDLSQMNRILSIDIDNIQVTVEAGLIADKLNEALKPYGFFFPPDPGSAATCTIGGQIANNASGMRCVKYGTTKNYVLNLEVVLADGTVIETGRNCLKSSAGYDLSRLYVGSEGTLGIITKAVLKIAPIPQARKLVMVSFPSPESAGLSVSRVFAAGVIPSACEILDKTSVSVLTKLDPNIIFPRDGDVVLFEVDGSKNAVDESAEMLAKACEEMSSSILITDDPAKMKEIWDARRMVGAAVSKLDPTKTRVYAGEDLGVPIRKLPEAISKVYEITNEVGITPMIYGHVGDGTVHVGLFIDVLDENDWKKLHIAADKLHLAAIELGGTVSSEHGIGAARGMYLEKQCGPAFEVMKAIKKALDPNGILNPGKLGL